MGTVARPPRLALCACALVLAGASLLAATTASGKRRPHTRLVIASKVFGRRYCELFLIYKASSGYRADVYNTYGLNACPQAAWNAIDTAKVANANHALLVVRNGPRFWAMNKIEKYRHGRKVIKNLGGVRLIEEATIRLADLNPAPYRIHRVDRTTTFIYNAGQTVYELRTSTGAVWVMQSWSHQIDPSIDRGALATLGSKLHLPSGWTYHARRLKRQLRVVTVSAAAQVLQDDLGDSYSFERLGSQHS